MQPFKGEHLAINYYMINRLFSLPPLHSSPNGFKDMVSTIMLLKMTSMYLTSMEGSMYDAMSKKSNVCFGFLNTKMLERVVT